MPGEATDTTTQGVIPGVIRPNMFCPKPGAGLKLGRFGPLATYTLLHEAMLVMGVTPYQLGRLLGAKYTSYVYSWLNGTINPSLGFTTRLGKLLVMLAAGVKLAEISWIDWPLGEIHWRPGKGPANHQDQVKQADAGSAQPVRSGSYRGRKAISREEPEA